MRRLNGYLVGTAVVVLIVAVIFIQGAQGTPTAHGHEHDEASERQQAPMPSSPPSVEELQQAIQGSGTTVPAAAATPPSERFAPPQKQDTSKASRWFEGSRAPQSLEEMQGKAKTTK